MKLYVNHIGYLLGKPARTAVSLSKKRSSLRCSLEHCGQMHIWKEEARGVRLPDWGDEFYYMLDLTERISGPGTYLLCVEDENKEKASQMIEIDGLYLPLRMANAARCYLKGERASGEWLKADHSLVLKEPPEKETDTEKRLDLHGGWYDATGDLGIHQTQLSHTGKFNPVQSFLPAWVCFKSAEHLRITHCKDSRILTKELLDEAYWGADYAMRLHIPGGGFYRSVDRGTAFGEAGERRIDYEYFHHTGHEEDGSYLEEEITPEHYQVGFRSGGGISAAVLAMAAMSGGASGEYAQEQYKEAAEGSFHYLLENNGSHVSDGKWNLLDWYEMLAAAVELYRLTGAEEYLEHCRSAADHSLESLYRTADGAWFRHGDGEFFYHPSDEGMPLICLAEYARQETDSQRREKTEQALRECMAHLMGMGRTPFGYAAFLRREGEEPRMFFPHDTEASPWWQGENARIASLAAAALFVGGCFGEKKEWEDFAVDQLSWIMGQNPFDSCMIEGYGRNNIQYFFEGQYDFMNSPGGICNGITARTDTGNGLEFIKEPGEACMDNWRWAEQWLPHACWYLYAEALLAVREQENV